VLRDELLQPCNVTKRANIVAMFVNLTRVKTSGEATDAARMVAEEMERWLEQIEGYEGFLMLTTEGTAVGLTFWENREVAERYRKTRLEFRDRMIAIAGGEIEETIELDVTYARLGRLLTDVD
jgi:heme-degrading monooxygenase HmoA